MDQNQNSSWQPISHVMGQKLGGEENITETPPPSAPNPLTLTVQNLALLEKLISHLSETVTSLNTLLSHIKGGTASTAHAINAFTASANISHAPSQNTPAESNAARVLEGVFDGTRMVGADGAFYPVPPNYASKSKLVEGDLMKLTITATGAFLYKQIGPTKRKRLIGELIKRQDGDTVLYDVLAENHVYHVLSAAITYYKGMPGDEVAIMVPEDGPSKWAAVEYIVKSAPHI